MNIFNILSHIFKVILIIYLIISLRYYDDEYNLRDPNFLRKASSECTLFLNKNDEFPINKPCKVLLIGSGARNTVKGGLGSGDVDTNFTTCEEGLEKAGFNISSISKKWFDDYIIIKQNNFRKHLNNLINQFNKYGKHNLFGMVSFPEVEYNLSIIENENNKSDIAIYVLSRNMGEGIDRSPIKGEVFLTETEIKDILYLDKNYKKFMLVLNVGGVIDLSPVKNVSNILLLSQLGIFIGDVLSDIILGKTNPSGKLATTWSKFSDYKFINEFGNFSEVNYKEGLYVGYRFFDSVGINPLYPFGFGKSYTEFNISKLNLSNNKDEIKIKVRVKNIGKYYGKEVIQIYVSPSQENDDKPFQSLVAYSKTKNLKPNDYQDINIKFILSDIARYDIKSAQYILDKGNYIIRVGNSSRNTTIFGYIYLNENIIVEQLKNIIDNPGFDEFKPKIIINDNLERYQSINLTQKDFDSCKMVNYTYVAPVSRKLLNFTTKDLINLCLGNYITNILDPEETKEKELGIAGTTTKKVSQIKNYLTMADGPAGLRLSKVYFIDNNTFHHRLEQNILNFFNYKILLNQKSISFDINTTKHINFSKYSNIKYQYPKAIPIATAIAQTFNMNLVKKIGRIISNDMKKFNIDILLAPGMNIHRNILCGRNFEYYSEDPLISGTMAAAMVQGVQSRKNKGATLKHFVANNQEFNRLNSNSKMSERTLREIYLRGFKIAIEKGNPLGLMTSYNLLNGKHTSENFNLIVNVLRNEWKYRGLIMTDWSSSGGKQFSKAKNPSQNSFNIIKAGVDIMMPGNKIDYEILEKKYKDNLLNKNDLLRCAGKVYEVIKLLKGD